MNRRGFLMGVAAFATMLWTDFKLRNDGAVFRVVRVDPEGSGMDYFGHEGHLVRHAQRCCRNCDTIFAYLGQTGPDRPGERGVDVRGVESVQFLTQELAPMNRAARRILAEIEQSQRLRAQARSGYNLAV